MLSSERDSKVHSTFNASKMSVANNFSSLEVTSNLHASFTSNIEKSIEEETSFNKSSFAKHLEKNIKELPSINSGYFSNSSFLPSKVEVIPSETSSHALEISPLPSVYREILLKIPSASQRRKEINSDNDDSSLEY